MEETELNQPKTYLTKIKNGWNGLSDMKKYGLIAVGLTVVIVALLYLTVFNTQEYAPIYSNLDVKTAGEVKSMLEENGFTDIKIGEGGSSILVPKSDVDRLRMDLAVNGFTPNTGYGYELFDTSSLGMSEQERQITYQRALEGELRRSIMSMDNINDARVHLNLTKDSLFVRDPLPSTASVVLDLKNSKKMSDEQVQGIIALVSGAVNNLNAENIQIVDTAGNLLSNGKSQGSTFGSGERVAQEVEYEMHLQDKVQAQLGKVFGYDKIAVSVRVNLNQNSTEERTEDYEDGPVLSEQINFNKGNESTDGETVEGSPIDNNIQNVIEGTDVEQALGNPDVLDYNQTTNYQPDSSVTHTIKPPGEIERISVSVIYSGDLTTQMANILESHVQNIVGINETRGDSISVAGVPFNLPTLTDEGGIDLTPENWFKGLSTFEYFLYGTILATVLVLIIFAISKRRENKMLIAEINANTLRDVQPDTVVEDDLRAVLNPDSFDSFDQSDNLVDNIKAYFRRDVSGAIDLLRIWMDDDSSAHVLERSGIKMEGLDKAARLLIALGKTIAADVMKNLSHDEVVKIAQLISSVKMVPQEVTQDIYEEFASMIEARHYISQGGYDFAREALQKAIGKDRSTEILSKINNKQRSKKPFESIRQMDAMQLLNALIDEHPQTIALVLCYLPTEKAAKIVSQLPAKLQSEVAERIGTMKTTNSRIVDAVESEIEKRMKNLVTGDMTNVGGLNMVVDILNTVDRTTQKSILNLLNDQNPLFAEQVSDNLFTFEDIVYLDNVSIQRVIRETDPSVLPLALKGASDKVMDLIMKNISVRAAERLKEDIDYLGPVRLSEVEKAQHDIVSIIRRLEESGEIMISRGEENDIVY